MPVSHSVLSRAPQLAVSLIYPILVLLYSPVSEAFDL